MRTKTIIDLLSLSVSLYMLSKDHDFLKTSAAHTSEGKKRTEEDYRTEEETENSGGDEFLSGILNNAKQLKEDLQRKMDEVAVAVYEKMHIAHTDEIKKLADEIALLRTELALTEAKVINLQQANG